MQIDLIYLTAQPQDVPDWAAGNETPVRPDPAAIADLCARLLTESRASFFLFWGQDLALPEAHVVAEIAASPGHVWHAGLRLGQTGLPHLLDFVNPVWRFNRDPAPDKRATSWRLSLRACLVGRNVLTKLGGPSPAFDTFSGASLELGHRWIRQGALVQHEPSLLTVVPQRVCSPPSLTDEFYFIRCAYGHAWMLWALGRALMNGYVVASALRACWRARQRPMMAARGARRATQLEYAVPECSNGRPSVTVLIPTLDRYPYLFQLLGQLARQTAAPEEVIVVDQTPLPRRQVGWESQFCQLPLHVIRLDKSGQCSSRNAGLRAASSDTVLLLDDDDEVPPNLIASHLRFLRDTGADASCGAVVEVGAGMLPEDFRYVRASDVFPANNTLLKREALATSGLFDLAYERGERADGDLGMRLYLEGKLLGLNPTATVLHWHAPRGGLRAHRARAVTRGGSRATVWQRHLLAPTEGYLWNRYFTQRQVHEALLIRTVSTLGGTGKSALRVLRLLLMILLIPDTYLRNRASLRAGKAVLTIHPTIPPLEENGS